MRIVLTFFYILAFVVCTPSVYASFDEKTRTTANTVMRLIFDDIVAAKNRYPVLNNFSEAHLTENEYGVYSIDYRSKDSVDEGYAFGVTLVEMEDPNVWFEGNVFNVGFPLLDVRFSGYQKNSARQVGFDVRDTVQRNGQVLWDLQQEYMPYQLSLKPVKDRFLTNEDIEFIVALTNTTKQTVKVKDLGEQSLYFVYDNKVWGAKEISKKPSRKDDEVVLRAGETIRRRFRSRGFAFERKIDIYCSYVQTYKGVKPSATLTVNVVAP